MPWSGITHQHLLTLMVRLPSDFEPYGARNRDDQFGPDCFEPLESSVLVDPYEARVACSRVSEPATDRGPVHQRAPVALCRPSFSSTETEASQSADGRDLARYYCCRGAPVRRSS